jgi:hypothetical protein
MQSRNSQMRPPAAIVERFAKLLVSALTIGELTGEVSRHFNIEERSCAPNPPTL